MKHTIFTFFLLVICNNCLADKQNVLMIIIDDLNHWVSHLGRNADIKTPNIDKLASRGVSFANAYTAAPQCLPSRIAVFTGKRPFNTGVYANGSSLTNRVRRKDFLANYLREQGYSVAAAGKVHEGIDGEYAQIDEYQQRGAIKKAVKLDSGRTAAQSWSILDGNDEVAEDEKTVRYVEKKLKQQFSKPFFLIAGLYKPHLSWHIPKKYYDLYPLSSIKLPVSKADDLDDLDKQAAYSLISGPEVITDKASEVDLKKMVRAYMAAVSYADAQVGRIIKALDDSTYADNTLVVLWSDHGYHLGEKQLAAKRVLWEEATRAPMIWSVPGVTPKGKISTNTVDFMTIFPTLCDLLEVPTPEHVEGKSIRTLLAQPEKNTQHYAMSTYLQGNHSIRTRKWRYIHYKNGSEELYNEEIDPYEWYNLASKPENAALIKKFRALLPQKEKPLLLDRPRRLKRKSKQAGNNS